jgi:BirA family biotin operon repressor/biotin-[acetyl-CoA-carboxylase] ligase
VSLEYLLVCPLKTAGVPPVHDLEAERYDGYWVGWHTIPLDMRSLNIPLLNRVRAAAGDYVPLDRLGSDAERVRGDLEALASFGFGIERHPYRGAAYIGPAERLCPDQIEHDLATRRIGVRIAVWSRVASTNDLAARAGASVSNDGLVVLAEEQTAGRGRRGRRWTAPPRSSILMSVLLFPPADLAPAVPESAFGCAWLTALGAVATAEVVAAWTGRDATIKWPNDVRVDGRKIAGILVERATPHHRSAAPGCSGEPARGVVIGIGLNVNLDHDAFPPELRSRATSLRIERGGTTIDRSEVARDLIRRLDHWYEASLSFGCETLNVPWCTRSEHVGRDVRVVTPTGPRAGRLVDLDVRHGLTLALETGHEPDADGGHAAPLIRLPLAEILALHAVHPHDPTSNATTGSGTDPAALID